MLQCPKGFGVRQMLTLITGMVECLCFAGIVFGWASLVFILKTQGFFGSHCVNSTEIDGSQVLDCRGQDEQLSGVFTSASVMNNFLTLLTGFIFDRFGSFVVRLLGICLYISGTLLLAFSTPALSVLLFPALPLIAVSGRIFLITNIQVANLFGDHRSTIITVLSGSYHSSAIVFLIIKLLYESGIPIKASFLFMAACSIFHVLRTFFLLPRTLIPYPLPQNYSYGFSCGKSEEYVNHSSQTTTDQMETAHEEPVKPEKTFRECILSRFFFFCLIWFSVIELRIYLFIGTLNPALELLTNEDPLLVSQFLNAFAFTQLCAVLCAPWNGFIMDRLKRKYRDRGMNGREAELNSTIVSLFLASFLALVFSISAAIPVLLLQYFTFVMQVLTRAFLQGTLAAFVSVAFPPCHFGKVYGLIVTLASAVSLLQYVCFVVVESLLDGDPLYVNIAMAVLVLFSLIHPVSVFLHCRRLASQQTQQVS
ncbi:equilibrative nucleobase transporter 1-like [Vanacampus margaritifer]